MTTTNLPSPVLLPKQNAEKARVAHLFHSAVHKSREIDGRFMEKVCFKTLFALQFPSLAVFGSMKGIYDHKKNVRTTTYQILVNKDKCED